MAAVNLQPTPALVMTIIHLTINPKFIFSTFSSRKINSKFIFNPFSSKKNQPHHKKDKSIRKIKFRKIKSRKINQAATTTETQIQQQIQKSLSSFSSPQFVVPFDSRSLVGGPSFMGSISIQACLATGSSSLTSSYISNSSSSLTSASTAPPHLVHAFVAIGTRSDVHPSTRPAPITDFRKKNQCRRSDLPAEVSLRLGEVGVRLGHGFGWLEASRSLAVNFQ